MFEVAREHGLRTAWSDKHPAYEILNGSVGHGGAGSVHAGDQRDRRPDAWAGGDWTTDNAATQQYDGYKVQAVLNEIDGFDHSGSTHVGRPGDLRDELPDRLDGEKLPSSDGLTGGYGPGTRNPGPLLRRALGFINTKVGAMAAELRARGLSRSTAIVLSAKHGQSPVDPNLLTRIPDGPIISGLNGAWASAHPGAGPLVLRRDRRRRDPDVADRPLAGGGRLRDRLPDGPRRHRQHGLRRSADAGPLRAPHASSPGPRAARYFHVPVGDPRHPDVWGVVQHGVVYTGGKSKIAEHGGSDTDDRAVPLVVYAPDAVRPRTSDERVETTQIAPTILRLLGLSPRELQAVQIEGTRVLPGIG